MKASLASALLLCCGLARASPLPSSDDENGLAPRASDFWYPAMDHTSAVRGYAPYAPDAVNWPLYVSARANDAQSVIDAVNQGNRPMMWAASAPRVVYVPPGVYEFDSDLWLHVDTVIYGDARNPPVFKPGPNFPRSNKFFIRGECKEGRGRDKTFASGPDGQGELCFSTALKNVVIDLSDWQADGPITALDWSVAQNTHLQGIHIKLAEHSGNDENGQIGIQMLRGSSLALSDVVIEGGQYGVWHNTHQQALYKNFTFRRMN
ncbi:hypothetical protein KEM52_002885, partial [Ascosphaera acerosa]